MTTPTARLMCANGQSGGRKPRVGFDDRRFAEVEDARREHRARAAFDDAGAEPDDVSFDMLTALGFTRAAVDAANAYCCGALPLERDRKSGAVGTDGSVRLPLGVRRLMQKK